MKHPNLTVITLDPMANATLSPKAIGYARRAIRFTQDDNENVSNIL